MKVVVQASGGIESTVMLADAIRIYGIENVYPISFDDDSVIYHSKDRTAVKRVITNLKLQKTFFTCSVPQSDRLEHVRDEEYKDVGFIPGLKLAFNSASLSYAQSVDATQVWIGNMKDNVYPDETPEFLDALQNLYNTTYGSAIHFKTPYSMLTKTDMIKLGVKLGVDLFDTVSCGDERTGALNCGRCDWCTKRKQAFIAAEVVDKTDYLWG